MKRIAILKNLIFLSTFFVMSSFTDPKPKSSKAIIDDPSPLVVSSQPFSRIQTHGLSYVGAHTRAKTFRVWNKDEGESYRLINTFLKN